MTTPQKQWTGAQKLRVVLAAHGLSETELGALLRREGLHAAQLEEWRAAARSRAHRGAKRADPGTLARRASGRCALWAEAGAS
jgi:hypothetical protein